MPNKNYIRGRALEYQVVSEALEDEDESTWSQRMAGSHSPFDVITVYPKRKLIVFVQCKTKLSKKSADVITEQTSTDGWRVITYKRTKYIRRTK